MLAGTFASTMKVYDGVMYPKVKTWTQSVNFLEQKAHGLKAALVLNKNKNVITFLNRLPNLTVAAFSSIGGYSSMAHYLECSIRHSNRLDAT
jgi:hypothetical protein